MAKLKAKKSKKTKSPKKKTGKTALEMFNEINFMEDYAIIGKFCNLPPSKKDWIEVRRYELQASANKYEHLMGEYLINKGIKFIHQAPFVINGKIYFLDFYLPERRLAVEVDGIYHESMRQSDYDATRDYNFRSIGIKTLRINNNETHDWNQLDIRLAIASKQQNAKN